MAMLRVHLIGYRMEKALDETTILLQFAGLSLERIPDETTTLNFRYWKNTSWRPASSV